MSTYSNRLQPALRVLFSERPPNICVVHDDLGRNNRTTRYNNCRFSAASLALPVIFSVSWNIFGSFTKPFNCICTISIVCTPDSPESTGNCQYETNIEGQSIERIPLTSTQNNSQVRIRKSL